MNIASVQATVNYSPLSGTLATLTPQTVGDLFGDAFLSLFTTLAETTDSAAPGDCKDPTKRHEKHNIQEASGVPIAVFAAPDGGMPVFPVLSFAIPDSPDWPDSPDFAASPNSPDFSDKDKPQIHHDAALLHRQATTNSALAIASTEIPFLPVPNDAPAVPASAPPIESIAVTPRPAHDLVVRRDLSCVAPELYSADSIKAPELGKPSISPIAFAVRVENVGSASSGRLSDVFPQQDLSTVTEAQAPVQDATANEFPPTVMKITATHPGPVSMAGIAPVVPSSFRSPRVLEISKPDFPPATEAPKTAPEAKRESMPQATAIGHAFNPESADHFPERHEQRNREPISALPLSGHVPDAPRAAANTGPRTEPSTEISMVRAAEPDVVLQSPNPHPAPHAKEIAMSIRGSESSNIKVDIHVVDRAGSVRVAVRTPDAGMAESLQAGLSDLVHRLEHKGLEAETWTPGGSGDIPASQPHSIRESAQDMARDPRQSSQQDNSNQHHGGRNRPRWVAELEDTMRTEREQ